MTKIIKKILILSFFLFLISAGHAFAADRYWVGGSGTWNNSTTNWSATSGGAGGASRPTTTDNVYFDTASNATSYTVTLGGGFMYSSNLNIAAPATGTVSFNGSGNLYIYSNLISTTATAFSSSASIYFEATTTGKTLTWGGMYFPLAQLIFNGVGGGWTFQDDLNYVSDIDFKNGTLDTNGKTVVITSTFVASGTGTRVLNLGASTIDLSKNNGTLWNISGPTNLTVNAGTSTIKYSCPDSANSNRTFTGGAKTYYKLWNTFAGTYPLVITDSNTFEEITITGNNRKLYFTAGTTTTFTAAGAGITTSCTGITITSATSATHTLTKSSGTVTITNTTLSYSTAQGGATWDSSAVSNTDAGNNSGWSLPPITISGTANGNNGATVRVAINGIIDATHTGTIASSAWSIASVPHPTTNDIITVFVDTVADNLETTGVTKYSGGAVTGMVLNTGVLTIGSSENTSVSTTDLTQYENSDDEDVMHSSTSGALLVDGGSSYTNETLSILASNTLTVASASTETITTEKITNAGTITATGTPTITMTGASTTGTLFTNTGTFTADSSTVVMSPDAAVTLTSGTITFYNLSLTPTITAGRTYTFGSSALTINGDFTINPTAGSALALTVNAGANITVATGKTTTITKTTSATSLLDMRPSSTDYDLSTGLLNVATGGTLDLTSVLSATALTLTATSGTLFTLAGTFTITSGTPTVVMSGNGDATINSGAITFYNLTSSGTGVKTLGASITINNNMTVSAGTFDPTTSYTATGSGTNVLSVTGTVRSQHSTFAGDYVSFETVTLNSGSTVDYILNGTQTVSNTISPYYNLTVSTGGTKTLGGDITVSNVMTIGSGATFDASSYTLTLSGTTGTPFVKTGTFTPGTSTVTYSGDKVGGNTTVVATTYKNLTINNGSETFDLSGTTVVSGNLTITAGTLDTVSGQNYTLSVAGNWANSGTFTARSGTVTFNNGYYTITKTNIETTGNDTSQTSYTTGSIAPSANKLVLLAVDSSRSPATANEPTVTGAGMTWTKVDTKIDAANLRRTTVFRALSASPGSGVLTIDFAGQSQSKASWSIVEFDGIDTSGTNGSGAIGNTASNEVTGTNTGLTITLGTFGSSANATYGAYRVGVTTSVTEGSGFTEIGEYSGNNTTIQTQWRADNDTTVDISYASVSTVTIGVAVEIVAGTLSNSISGNTNFYNLTKNGAGTTTLAGNVTATNALTVSLGTLDTASYPVNALNLTINGGTFLPRGSDVSLTGTGTLYTYSSGTFTPATSTIKLTDTSATAKSFGGGYTFNNLYITGAGTGTYTITGSNTFNDFKDDGTVAHTIEFTAGTTQIIGSLSVNGNSGNVIILKSTSNGSVWTITDSLGNNTVNYLSLQDSTANGGANFLAINSTNTSGNTGWVFPFYGYSGGGGGVESSATPDTPVTGGGQSGGSGIESGGTPDTPGTGGNQGGGSGDVGFLNRNYLKVLAS